MLENMDNGQVTGSVFLDLRKAFDTVDHLILINKLKIESRRVRKKFIMVPILPY